MIDNHKKLTLFEVSDLNISPFAHFLGRKKGLHGNEFCTSELLRVFFWWGGGGGLYYWNFTVNTYIYNEDKNESRNFILHT